MKKYSFLVFQPEYDEFLKDIQELGVLHVIEKEEEIGEEIKENYRLLKKHDDTIKLLHRRNIEQKKEKKDKDGITIINEISEIFDKKDKLVQEKTTLLKEASNAEPWGDFSSETIQNLENKGIYLRFFTCPAKKFDPEWHEKYDIQEISFLKGTTYFVVVLKSKEADIDIEAEEFPTLHKSYKDIRKQAKVKEKEIAALEKELDKYAMHYIPALEASKSELENSTEFEKVVFHSGSEADDKIRVLEGWVPLSKMEKLNAYLDAKSLVYIVEDPAEDENVPILLKNNWFARLFEPIGKMFMFPVYKELDLVPFFAPFFMLFFGFCLGDAGYGLIFVIGASLYKLKAQKALKPLISLVQILGLSTVLFGAVSGTFFGMNLIDSGYTLTDQSIQELRQENIPTHLIDSLQAIENKTFKARAEFESKVEEVIGEDQFTNYRTTIIKSSETKLKPVKNFRHMMLDPDSMFKLAILFGFIQIIFGMIIRVFNIIKQKGIVYSLPVVGWLIGIIGAVTIFILYRQGIIIQYKPFAYSLIIIWAILILGFSNPKSIFASIGAGIGDIYFTVTGFLGDLLSYIRLFAIGLSSAILGFVFNDLAVQLLSMPPVIGELFFVLLLLFGHSINIFLSALGSFVHPMRLTFVEFYKNAGFTGGGKEYKPFEYKLKN